LRVQLLFEATRATTAVKFQRYCRGKADSVDNISTPDVTGAI
jgi:hypothetical protein